MISVTYYLHYTFKIIFQGDKNEKLHFKKYWKKHRLYDNRS